MASSFQSLILNLKTEVALSEDFKKLCSFLLSPFIVSVEQLILHFSARQAERAMIPSLCCLRTSLSMRGL